jgi:hypothetical protein
MADQGDHFGVYLVSICDEFRPNFNVLLKLSITLKSQLNGRKERWRSNCAQKGWTKIKATIFMSIAQAVDGAVPVIGCNRTKLPCKEKSMPALVSMTYVVLFPINSGW